MGTKIAWTKGIRSWLFVAVASLALAGCDKLKGGDSEQEPKAEAKEEEPEASPGKGLTGELDTASFTGTWLTPWGPVTMVQKGSSITGNYSGQFTGTLDGTVRGGVANVTWKQTNGERGKARFSISEDGDSFKGTWGSRSSATDGGPWNGTRKR